MIIKTIIMGDMVFINGNVPSSKNSRVRTRSGMMIMSKTCQNYMKQFGDQWKIIPDQFKNLQPEDFPISVGFHFVRNSRHRWDFGNICQMATDLMVKNLWLPDDSMDYLIPYCLWIDGKHYSYDKENPGVQIEIVGYFNG